MSYEAFFETVVEWCPQESDWECPICLEGATTDLERSPLKTIRCKHVFGAACLITWAEDKATCPMCRQEMYTKPFELPVLGNLDRIFEFLVEGEEVVTYFMTIYPQYFEDDPMDALFWWTNWAADAIIPDSTEIPPTSPTMERLAVLFGDVDIEAGEELEGINCG
jgi:hypothetical protein